MTNIIKVKFFRGSIPAGREYTYYTPEPVMVGDVVDVETKMGTARAMVTETFINHEVYISDFTATNTGGAGDVSYSVTFTEAKEIKVYTTSELNIKPAAKTNETSSATRPAPAAASAKTYTVKSGDSLWAIAKRYLGSGSRYNEIYELNKSTIGSNPNLIYPGQVFTLPS